MVPRLGSLISVVYTMQSSERITMVQSQSTQNLKSSMRRKGENWGGFSATINIYLSSGLLNT